MCCPTITLQLALCQQLGDQPDGRSPPSFTISAPSVVPPWLDSQTPYLPDSSQTRLPPRPTPVRRLPQNRPPNAFAAPPRCADSRKIGHPKAVGRPIGHKRQRRTSLPLLPGRRIRPEAWSGLRPEPVRTRRTSWRRWRSRRSGSSGWWSSGKVPRAAHGRGAR